MVNNKLKQPVVTGLVGDRTGDRDGLRAGEAVRTL